MKTFKSFIKLAAVAAAVVGMSSCLTSCDILLDEPYYETYHVVEYHHAPVYHSYYHSSPVYVPNGTIVSGRR